MIKTEKSIYSVAKVINDYLHINYTHSLCSKRYRKLYYQHLPVLYIWHQKRNQHRAIYEKYISQIGGGGACCVVVCQIPLTLYHMLLSCAYGYFSYYHHII
ncbi:hypothetical protein UMNK88_1717 [Escherichia coli UMNK88]|nr:hypothetical protein UMNK88_1717 [Escherichia coli UMNK88]